MLQYISSFIILTEVLVIVAVAFLIKSTVYGGKCNYKLFPSLAFHKFIKLFIQQLLFY